MPNSINRIERGRSAVRRRAMAWSFILILGGAIALPLAGYLYANMQPAHAQAGSEDANPRSNLWRSVRGGNEGYTAVRGDETNVLIQNGGHNWRQLRNGPIATYGGWFLFLSAVAIMAFFALRGRVDLDAGRSGQVVKRWALWERMLHWYTAILFIVLSVTGVSLLFGRKLLIPLLGPQGFAGYAQFAKDFHNYLGPFFAGGVALIIVCWIWHNFPKAEDFKWFAQGGGILGKAHPSAGRMNAGEKVWFWLICTVGVAVCVTGVVLDFPGVWDQTRDTMQKANVIHSIAAIAWIAVFFGHVYIGTIGSEGSLEGMTTGYVDANWAKQHHDLWYEQVKDQAVSGAAVAGGGAMAAAGGAVAAVAGAASSAAAGMLPQDSVLRRHYEQAASSGYAT